jgi:hypothetical protein
MDGSSAPSCAFVLPLRAAPGRRSFQHLAEALGRLFGRVAKREHVHMAVRWTDYGTRSTISPPTAASRQKRIPSSAAVWMVDHPFALAPAPTAALATVKRVRTPLLTPKRLGVDDVLAHRGRGSEEFGPLETTPHQQGTDPPSWFRTQKPRRDGTLDQILFAGTWLRTVARLGLRWSPALADAGLRP